MMIINQNISDYNLKLSLTRLPKYSIIMLRAYHLSFKNRYSIGLLIKKYINRYNYGHKLIIANDITMAIKLKADGVHIPEKLRYNLSKKLYFLKKSNFIFSTSVHSAKNINKIQKLYDIYIISPVFNTNSDSYKQGLGIKKISKLILHIKKLKNNYDPAIFLLGGIDKTNISRLKTLDFQGIAGIKYYLPLV